MKGTASCKFEMILLFMEIVLIESKKSQVDIGERQLPGPTWLFAYFLDCDRYRYRYAEIESLYPNSV